MTVDELKSMPKGHFIVMKTGCHPMKTRLKLFFKWGIVFEDAYSISEKAEQSALAVVNDDLRALFAVGFLELSKGLYDSNNGYFS